MVKYLLCLALVLGSVNGYCGDVRLGFGFGTAKVNVSSKNQASDYFSDVRPDVLTIYGGYQFSDVFIVDLALSETEHFFDIFNLSGEELYSKELTIGLRLTKGQLFLEPALGLSSWKMKLDNKPILDSLPRLTLEEKGTDLVFKLAAGIQFTESFGMAVAYRFFETDYIKSHSYLLNFGFYL